MKAHAETADIGMDSFLDIVTNVIGVLILIACAIALQVKNFVPPKNPPIFEDAPKEMESKFFLCVDGRCEMTSERTELILEKVRKASIAKFDNKDKWDELFEDRNLIYNWNNSTHRSIVQSKNRLWDKIIAYCNGRDDWDDEFQVKMVRSKNDLIQLKFEMKQKDTDPVESFKQTLETLDNSKHYISIWVDKESYVTFRKIRDVLRTKGFRFGWDPKVETDIYYQITNPWNLEIDPIEIPDGEK